MNSGKPKRPIFGKNGAVINSDTMTDALREDYTRTLTFAEIKERALETLFFSVVLLSQCSLLYLIWINYISGTIYEQYILSKATEDIWRSTAFVFGCLISQKYIAQYLKKLKAPPAAK